MPDALLQDPYVLRLVERKAGTLAGTYGFGVDETKDIAQNFLLDLWARSENYDPTRSTFRTFASRIIDHCIASLIESRQAQSRGSRYIHVASDDLGYGDCGANSSIGRTLNADDIHLGIDVQKAVAMLPLRLQRVCCLLSEHGSTEVARLLGVSRPTIYRQIHQIRRIWLDAGLGVYGPVRQRTTISNQNRRAA